MGLALIKNLRPGFIVGFIVVWNAICGVGMLFNGGLGRLANAPSALVMALASSGLVLIGFGSLFSNRVRVMVLRPEADLSAAAPGLMFLGLIGTFLMFGALYTALRLSHVVA